MNNTKFRSKGPLPNASSKPDGSAHGLLKTIGQLTELQKKAWGNRVFKAVLLNSPRPVRLRAWCTLAILFVPYALAGWFIDPVTGLLLVGVLIVPCFFLVERLFPMCFPAEYAQHAIHLQHWTSRRMKLRYAFFLEDVRASTELTSENLDRARQSLTKPGNSTGEKSVFQSPLIVGLFGLVIALSADAARGSELWMNGWVGKIAFIWSASLLLYLAVLARFGMQARARQESELRTFLEWEADDRPTK